MIFPDIFQFSLKTDKISDTARIPMCDFGFSLSLNLILRRKKKFLRKVVAKNKTQLSGPIEISCTSYGFDRTKWQEQKLLHFLSCGLKSLFRNIIEIFVKKLPGPLIMMIVNIETYSSYLQVKQIEWDASCLRQCWCWNAASRSLGKNLPAEAV